jgi:hypothetical protein
MIRSHSGHTFPADKMLPVGEALRSSKDRWGKGRKLVEGAKRMRGVIAEMKRQHKKKARSYAKKLCRETG